ncbi:MAG: MBL fold metallo-hydrolase [Chitinophagaceae bacterium]|nr:MBL fold metallo-hydrolase [Chitinophagaceae bacterium]
MSLFITSLNSGSNGNCYYVGNGKEAVLVDVGISCREVEKRMKRLGLDIYSVKAIIVSHEHSDHITGVPGLCKKFHFPVYITAATLQSGSIPIARELVHSFRAHESISVGELTVTAFPKFHDAIDPHSFIISGNGINVGVFTDIGSCCKHVSAHFSKCHAVFLESNYCEDLLQKGSYPYYLKERIRGGRGHLSNKQALEIFNRYKTEKLTHLVLSHLSKNNNDPQLVERIFAEHAGNVKVVVASRYQETPVYCVTTTQPTIVRNIVREQRQLSLF